MDATFDPYHLWLGIPPAEQPPHHYRLLGLTLFESNRAVIDDAASRQTLHVQGYRAGSHAQAAQRILGELAAARACLLNAATKAAYDDELRRSLEFPATDRPRQPASDSPRNVVVVAAPDPHLPVRARNLAEAPVIPSIPLDDEDPVTDETPTPESLAATPRSAPVGRGSRWRGPLLAGVGAMLFIPLAMAIVGPREPLPETVAQATPAPLAATGESSKAGPAVERTTPIEAIAEATQPSTESHPAIEHAPPASPASVATLKLPAPAGKPRLGQVWTQAIDGMGDVGRSVAALVAVQASMYVPPATHEIAEEPLSVPRKAAARWPAPNEFDLKEAETIVAEFEKSVRETNDDLDSWEGASWKTINTLFDRATNQESRPAIAFQLLIRAEALAAGRDGFSPTERPADERAEMFELDVPTYVAELAASLKRKPLYENRPPDPLDQSRPLRWLGLADRAASDEDFALAAACCESARLWAQHFDDPPLRDLVARRTADVETVAAAFERAKFARERWRAVRDDASAAAEWGRYLCLFAGDFPHGAKHLAKGTDLAAKAARAELTAPVDDAAAVVLGDLWWDAAEAEAD
ncbi:MAG TPA: hypothetical protein VGE52_06575, partial [Pirellulales bacterium]